MGNPNGHPCLCFPVKMRRLVAIKSSKFLFYECFEFGIQVNIVFESKDHGHIDKIMPNKTEKCTNINVLPFFVQNSKHLRLRSEER
jgi:hypothetical protein